MYAGFVFLKFKYMLLRCKQCSVSTCFPALPKGHIEILCLGHFLVIGVSIAAHNYMPLYLSCPWQMGIWVVKFFSRPTRFLWLSYPRALAPTKRLPNCASKLLLHPVAFRPWGTRVSLLHILAIPWYHGLYSVESDGIRWEMVHVFYSLLFLLNNTL